MKEKTIFRTEGLTGEVTSFASSGTRILELDDTPGCIKPPNLGHMISRGQEVYPISLKQRTLVKMIILQVNVNLQTWSLVSGLHLKTRGDPCQTWLFYKVMQEKPGFSVEKSSVSNSADKSNLSESEKLVIQFFW